MFVRTTSIFIGLLFYTQVNSVYKNVRTDCAASGSICNPDLENACCDTNTKCKLILHLHYACDQERGLGKFCLSDQECDHVAHAKCSEENRCICRSRNLQINGTCVPLVGGFCWNNEECATPYTVCIDRECRCTVGFIQNFDRCINNLNKIACHNSDYCKTFSRHAICSSENRCKCKHNYTLTETSCLPQLDTNCENDEPCVDKNSVCIKNVCKCKPDYKSQYGVCVLNAGLHDRCTNNSDCNDSKFTICGVHKRCTCRNNYFAKNGTCVPGLGAYCRTTETCAVENSFCIDKKCQCMRPTTSIELPAPEIAERCPEPDLLGKKCETNSDCKFIINAVCSINKCSCDKNFTAFGKLACSPTLNGPCLNDNQCLFENFKCIDEKCQCRPHFFPRSESQCVDENDVHFCYDSFDCSDLWHSRCSMDKKCVCQPDNISVNKSCLPLLNGYCWRHDQCLALNSECFDYRCACKSDFIAIANNFCARK